MTSYEKLAGILAKAADLEAVTELLDWDQQVYMPQGAAEGRAFQAATLQTLRHQLLTSSDFEKTLEHAENELKNADPDSDESVILRKAAKEFRRCRRLPEKWVEKKEETCARAYDLWIQAREKKDYRVFEPMMEKIIVLNQEYAAFFPEFEHAMDSRLDLFDEGLTVKAVDRIFAELEPAQKKMIEKATALPPPDTAFLQGDYPAEAQLKFIRSVLDRMGYDWNCGRQDLTVHPFTCTFGLYDVRITTKIMPGMPFSSLFSSMHECGHALYEQGILKKYNRTPLGTGTSFSVHESQSRLWENAVGRSREFWEFLYPAAVEHFPVLRKISLDDFLAAVNKTEKSCIRTESDELTYNMHIILRYRLECAMMEGKLKAADLRDAWNSGMEEFLGVTPENDVCGVLQDVHWTMGEFGYFPSYALGNVMAEQFRQAALRENPELPDAIRSGDLAPLRTWLKEHVHQFGAKYPTLELLKKSGAGTAIDPKPYLTYLENKYTKEF